MAGVVAAALILGGRQAEGRADPSPFDISLSRDLTLLGGGLVLWTSIGAVATELRVPGACDPCAAASLNALDRPVVNFQSTRAKTARDVTVAIIPVLAASGFLLDNHRWGWRGVGEDLLMMAQAITFAGALQQLSTLAVRRPRPYMYRPGTGEPRGLLNDEASFFSGHTGAVFAAVTSFATIFSLRRPRSDLRPLVWVGGLLLASVVPYFSVASGEHFWSDVLVGAAVGSAIGILVPLLHRRSLPPHWLQVSASAGGLGLSGQF